MKRGLKYIVKPHANSRWHGEGTFPDEEGTEIGQRRFLPKEGKCEGTFPDEEGTEMQHPVFWLWLLTR